MAENTDKNHAVEVTAHDLPLHCPQPDAPLWARHPRVFLDVLKEGQATCPYCSAHYVFTGERPAGHH
ncbi:zinc-finger domain-containing protein [Pseudothauera nasutitermitis]|uniref:Zinc-finger domain-containing protein n=1 Tax=Pseudothauera nasutitermitis TaxID=2565930 RepID=A0A4S4ASC1_9RHOO|nr:zinc-finger domain-containing protein [Pseudothauera nasutitermitis]THF62294.1 zinc-finger domain-containing protein [Pseudothauera nasutitermitis]